MRLFLLAATLAVAMMGAPPAAAGQGSPAWVPGVFRGLVVGRATFAEVRRVLGEPRASSPAEEAGGVAWHDYGHDHSVLPARATLYVRRDTLVMVELVPDEPSRAEVLRRLGPGLVSTWYRECPGGEEEETVPVYRAAAGEEGAMESLEYPARGIFLSTGPEEVVAVVIGTTPVLESAAACPAAAGP